MGTPRMNYLDRIRDTITPKAGDTIAVWFSCGAASAVAAKATLARYGNYCNVRIINNPVIEEDADNLRFLKDVERWLNKPIESAVNSKYPDCSAEIVWETRKYMSGINGAPCTGELKKAARHEWEARNEAHWHVLGYTYDEWNRDIDFRYGERSNLLPILIDEKLTKKDCFEILMAEEIRLPDIYLRGYPNANCIGCVKATSPTYWNLVRREDPEIFQRRAIQSRRLGVRLVRYKGKRIFLDELPVDAIGRPMKNLQFECGIFCGAEKGAGIKDWSKVLGYDPITGEPK